MKCIKRVNTNILLCLLRWCCFIITFPPQSQLSPLLHKQLSQRNVLRNIFPSEQETTATFQRIRRELLYANPSDPPSLSPSHLLDASVIDTRWEFGWRQPSRSENNWPPVGRPPSRFTMACLAITSRRRVAFVFFFQFLFCCFEPQFSCFIILWVHCENWIVILLSEKTRG